MSAPISRPVSVMDIMKRSVGMLLASALDLIKIIGLPMLVNVGSSGLAVAFSSDDSNVLLSILAMVMGLVNLLSGFVALYANYVGLLYMCDVMNGRRKSNLFAYWKPGSSIIGCLGLGVLNWILSVVAVIPLIVGYICLVLPGVALTILLFSTTFMMFPVYLMKPERGVIETFKAVLQFTVNNWLVVLIAGLAIVGIALCIIVPIGVIGFFAGIGQTVMSLFSPNKAASSFLFLTVFFMILNAVLTGLMCFATFLYGNLYLVCSGDSIASASPASVAPPPQPSVFGTQSQPLTSPLPPQAPSEEPPEDNPPFPPSSGRPPGINPWGGS